MLDTNILFSGLFFPGKPSRILRLIKEKHILVLSTDIIREIYKIIDLRFPNRRYLFDSFLVLTKHEIIFEEEFKCKFSEAIKLIKDKKDIPILACALATKPDYFITGDKDFHTQEIKKKLKVVTPDEFLRLFRKK